MRREDVKMGEGPKCNGIGLVLGDSPSSPKNCEGFMTDYEAIVSGTDAPTLVLAGPGAGKTYLLADRVQRLLNQGVRKEQITLLTFGKDASTHTRDVLVDQCGDFRIAREDLPRISTINAFGYGIVREKPRAVGLRKTGLQVQGNGQIRELLFRDAALACGYRKEDGTAALKWKQEGDVVSAPPETLHLICEKYLEFMRKCNCIDFDDQVILACQILEADADMLAAYQEQSTHLLIDEYQDINAAQFRLIELLSGGSRSGLFVVGDDAQSIYEFRGASPKFILRFAEDFPGARTPPLACSRRCPKEIMGDAAKMLQRYYSEWTGPFDLEYRTGPGEVPEVLQVPSDKGEAKMVATIAQQAISEGKSVMVLAPKESFFPSISKALTDFDVPHDCPSSLLPMREGNRLGVMTDLARWVASPNDSLLSRVALEVLINDGAARVAGGKRTANLKPETLEARVAAETDIAALWEQVNRDHDLYSVIASVDSDSEPLRSIKNILLDLLESYEDEGKTERGEFAKRISIAGGVWDAAKMQHDLCAIADCLWSSSPTGFGTVQLMTMRKAKGLEAKVVILVGLEDDIIPMPSRDEAEEARLFYVSMTRAKERLYLLHAYKRPGNISFGSELMDKQRSRFIDVLGRKSEYKKI